MAFQQPLLPWLPLGVLFVLAFGGAPATTNPQQPAPSPSPAPVFDIAAIHLHEPQPQDYVSIKSSPFDGHFNAYNVSLFTLIWWSFEVPEARILDAPGWANTKRFDIEAAADPSVGAQLKALSPDAGRRQKERMVRALLADRFGLITHTETRELPIYQLVIAKGGPKLGATKDGGTAIGVSRGHIQALAPNSVATLAEQLSKVVGRDVVDKTRITGRYDLRLDWTPDDAAGPSSANSDSGEMGPSLFTALQEQLGLKLEPAKGSVQVLVVDHVEMPSAN